MDIENYTTLRALQESLDLLPGGIVIVDETNTIVLCNHYFAHILCNKNKESIINKNITQSTLVPAEIKKILIFDNELNLTSQQIKQCSFHYSLSDNTVIYFRILKDSINIDEKKFIIVIFADITEQVISFKHLKKNEQKYRFFLNSIPLGLLLIDGNTLEIKECNSKALELFNYDDYIDIAGKHLQNIFPSTDAKVFNLLKEKFESISNYECKVCINNQELYLAIDFLPITLDSNNYYIVAVKNITPLKKAHEELILYHSQIKYLLSSIDSILIGVSRGDTITHWNLTAEKIFGISEKEAIGKRIVGFNIPWEWDKIYIGITNSIIEKRPVTLPDVRYDSLYGQKRILGITVNPILDENGTLLGYLLFGRDITDKRISESEILQAQKLQSIGQLAAGIAHEINTPAQYVNDNLHFIHDVVRDLEGLMDDCDEIISLLSAARQIPQRLKTMLDKISAKKQKIDYTYCKEELPKAVDQSLEGISKIVSIVKSLKNFAHPDTQKKVSINLNSMLQDVITITRNEWKYIADLTTNFKPVDILVPCFPNQLNQVFLNMIINARDAIQEAIDKKLIEKGLIEISTDMNTDYAIVSIKDNGIGIPEDIMPKIFDPFFTTKLVGKGSGQGLAISHSIIYDKHKGMIRVESEYGKGTTFYVYLPLKEMLEM